MGSGCLACTPNHRSYPPTAEDRLRFYDLHGNGCIVADAAYRAVTLSQIETILAHIKRRCEAENWVSLRFGDCNGFQKAPGEEDKTGEDGVRVCLTANIVNLYDTCAYVIKPATEKRKCSLMEIMADGKQKPGWFVSHWWGETIKDFATCLQQHAKDRGLGTWLGKRPVVDSMDQSDCYFRQQGFVPSDHACYWVCAYANNQHALSCAVTKDPKDTSFYNAMQLAEGTVSVIDGDGVCFTRIWCCFEVYISLMNFAAARDYKYDIYTVHRNCFGDAAALVDGLTIWDQRGGVERGCLYKQSREGLFPVTLLESSLGVRLEMGKASVEDDRKHILNSLADRCDLDAEPLLQHPNYTMANSMLHGRLASSAPVPCLLNSELLRLRLLEALPQSRATVICANFNMDERLTPEILHAFIKALPQTVTHLSLSEIDSAVQPLPYDELDDLHNLQELELYHCQGFTLSNFNAGDRIWTREDTSLPNTRILRPSPISA